MRRVRLRRQGGRRLRRLVLTDLAREGDGGVSEEMIYFRHRCDDAWYEALIAQKGLAGKRITPARLRKLIVSALEKRRKEST